MGKGGAPGKHGASLTIRALPNGLAGHESGNRGGSVHAAAALNEHRAIAFLILRKNDQLDGLHLLEDAARAEPGACAGSSTGW